LANQPTRYHGEDYGIKIFHVGMFLN